MIQLYRPTGKFGNSFLTVHRTENLTPAAQMLGSLELHTRGKKAQKMLDQIYTQQKSDLCSKDIYITHVVVPRPGDLRQFLFFLPAGWGSLSYWVLSQSPHHDYTAKVTNKVKKKNYLLLMQSCMEGLFQHLALGIALYTACS